MELVRDTVLLLLACASAIAEDASGAQPRTRRGAAQRPRASAPDIQALSDAAARIRPLHRTMPDAQPGEWLADQHEDGQTFAEYQKVRPAGLGTDRRTIYVVPLGSYNARQREVMQDAADFLTIFYVLPIKWLDPIPDQLIPASARRVNPHSKELQFDSIHILQKVLPQRVPRDAAALLALTTTDLWPGNNWNFVFGQGSLGQPTGVWSMNRLGNAAVDAERKLLSYRMIKVATHETGHLFGIPHCIAYKCGMNGSNGLSETDRQPLAFCPECEAKVWLVSNANRVERYRRLAAFAQRHGFEQEAKLWTESAAALDGPP